MLRGVSFITGQMLACGGLLGGIECECECECEWGSSGGRGIAVQNGAVPQMK